MSDEIIRAAEAAGAVVPAADRLAIAMAILPSAELWANATTDASSLFRRDLLRDKTNLLLTFFEFVGKPPAAGTPEDVRA